jgi:hypothetical protein
MTDIVAAWLGLLLGLTGIGTLLGFVVRFLGGARGGLR